MTDTSPKYIATVNVPGHLPTNDDPPTFDTPEEAWAYLAEERRRGEEDSCDETCAEGPACRWGYTHDYSDTVATLDALSRETVDVRDLDVSMVDSIKRVGAVYGETPGYHGDHDLGLAYCVTLAG